MVDSTDSLEAAARFAAINAFSRSASLVRMRSKRRRSTFFFRLRVVLQAFDGHARKRVVHVARLQVLERLCNLLLALLAGVQQSQRGRLESADELLNSLADFSLWRRGAVQEPIEPCLPYFRRLRAGKWKSRW